MSETEHEIQFGDEVRIVRTGETEAHGYAGRTGMCLGFTTPSITSVTVVGKAADDKALNVGFDDQAVLDAWFATGLVEFVSHAAGTTIRVGDQSARSRNAEGSWS